MINIIKWRRNNEEEADMYVLFCGYSTWDGYDYIFNKMNMEMKEIQLSVDN